MVQCAKCGDEVTADPRAVAEGELFACWVCAQ